MCKKCDEAERKVEERFPDGMSNEQAKAESLKMMAEMGLHQKFIDGLVYLVDQHDPLHNAFGQALLMAVGLLGKPPDAWVEKHMGSNAAIENLLEEVTALARRDAHPAEAIRTFWVGGSN